MALPPRGGDFFDARSTHNPHIRKVGDTFLLLYMGTNYDGPTPTPENPEVWRSPRYLATWARKRIGLATSKSVRGPWKRLDTAAARAASRRVGFHRHHQSLALPAARRLVPAGLQVAQGKPGATPGRRRARAALHRSVETPAHAVALPRQPAHVEDPFLWYEDGRVQALMKDMTGEICGEKFAGVHVTSADG